MQTLPDFSICLTAVLELTVSEEDMGRFVREGGSASEIIYQCMHRLERERKKQQQPTADIYKPGMSAYTIPPPRFHSHSSDQAVTMKL